MQVKTTSALEQELSGCADLRQFLHENRQNQQLPALQQMLQGEIAQRGLRRADVIRRSGLNQIYGYQILSGKRKPGRDSLLCLCMGLQLPVERTQQLLRAAGYAPLYVRTRRDSAIYYALSHGQDAASASAALAELGEQPLL